MADSSLQEIIACIGHPVSGNPTQFVMERAFQAAGVDSRCLTLDVIPEDLVKSLDGMRAMGFRGAVVAEPHQQSASRSMDRWASAAEMIGEIDVISVEQSQLVGVNATVRAITQVLAKHMDVHEKRVVILGAGAASRAAALSVGLAAAAGITVVARDDSAADRVVETVSAHVTSEMHVQTWADLYRPPANSDILIQTTTAPDSDYGDRLLFDYEGLLGHMLVLDTRFDPPRTDLIKAAERAGCVAIDGMELLVRRAAVAFETWTGVPPDMVVVREAFEEFFMI